MRVIEEEGEATVQVRAWQKAFGVVALACITLALAAVACGSLLGGSGEAGRSALLEGGGFLGDLPTGGEHGNDKVRALKDIVHSARNGNALQEELRRQMGQSKATSGKKAEAIAAAAAAIAKILDVPSARSIVEGPKSRASSLVDDSSSSVSPSASSSKSDTAASGDVGQKLTPWLKTPKDEGRFEYTHQKLARTFSACATRSDYECNDQDTASQAHGWSDTPDRSAMGASAWEANGY